MLTTFWLVSGGKKTQKSFSGSAHYEPLIKFSKETGSSPQYCDEDRLHVLESIGIELETLGILQ